VNLTDASERANALVAAWIVKQYRDDGPNGHLRTCPDATTAELEGYDGQYGCETGCEYARLETAIVCPHGERDENYTYGEFGELADIIRDIERDAA
jgi:hypothetical protein